MAMNLGDARLSHVNTSRPQLNRAASKQSIAASDDYYSVSEGSNDDKDTIRRYQTPPLRTGFADTTEKGVEHQLPTHQEGSEPTTPRPSRQFPLHSGKTWQDPHADAGAPTPGLDDSEYIQFAIDQLTRDEEVSGKNRVSRDSRITSLMMERRERSNQNSRVISAPAAAMIKEDITTRESRIPSSKYSPAADTALQPSTVDPQRSSLEKPAQIEDLDLRQQTSSLFPPLLPKEERERAVLQSVRPRSSDYRYPKLEFVPGPLRLLPILALIVFCLALVVILIISTIFGAKNNGLLGYDGVGTRRYFIFEYLPQLLAAIVVAWLLVIQSTIQRILPFVVLSRSNGYPDEDVLARTPIYITNYLWPNTGMLRRDFSLKFCSIVFWLCLFTIPLASSLYQTRWYTQVSNDAFLWTTVQPVSIILIILYILLIMALVITYLYFNRYTTGLKWDPTSIADIIVLLRRTSNLTSSRTSKTTRNSSTRHSSTRPYSLGYWESSSRPGLIFHGIGAENEMPLARSDNESINDPEAHLPVQQSTFESWHSNHWDRNRTQPAFLRETYLILYAVTAIALLIAFLVVTYLHSELLSGFLPLLSTATSETASFTSFSPSNFLYSFVPSFVGLLMVLFWIPIDTAFRYLQPWATLTKQQPSFASQTFGHKAASTLLLSYPAALPFACTIRAISHGHVRIAWFSFISLISWTLPVLGGGIFTAQYVASSPNNSIGQDQARGGNILIRPDAAALYALTVFLILYAFSWLLTFPGAKRHAVAGPDGKPVDVRYLAGIRSVVDKSVLRDQIWSEPRTRIDLVTRLISGEGTYTKGGRTSGRWAMDSGRLVRL